MLKPACTIDDDDDDDDYNDDVLLDIKRDILKSIVDIQHLIVFSLLFRSGTLRCRLFAANSAAMLVLLVEQLQ